MSSRRKTLLLCALGAVACAGVAARLVGCGNSMGGTGAPTASTGTGTTAGAGTGVTSITAAPADLTVPAGFDVTSLGPRERACFLKTVNDLLSPCGQPMTIAACVNAKADCALCGRIARLAHRDCGEGLPPPVAMEAAVNSILSLQKPPATIDVSGAPVKGTPGAPITIVEFSDFECPHCRDVAPLLSKLVASFDGKVAFYFKHFPLSFHEYAPNAAAAAIAAGMQGKFWEFHDKLFVHQDELSKPTLLDEIAKELGLDVAKFNADRVAKSTLDRLAKDYADGEALDVKGTPAIFINGRKFEDYPEYDQLEGWLREELH